MNILTMDGRFEWDSRKNKENMSKHNIRFAEITGVFDDPFLLIQYDKSHSENEDRYIAIGAVQDNLIVFVCFTERNGRIRLISARRCNLREKEVYSRNVQAFTR